MGGRIQKNLRKVITAINVSPLVLLCLRIKNVSDSRVAMQIKMKLKGVYKGAIDGDFGKRSKAALGRYKRKG